MNAQPNNNNNNNNNNALHDHVVNLTIVYTYYKMLSSSGRDDEICTKK